MRWPLTGFTITQGYSAGHTANDLAAPTGTPILSPETGRIVGVNTNAAAYFGGMYIKVLGDDTGYTYYMGHCSQVLVTTGQRVTEGAKIGLVGMTGQATGPHVHLEISKSGQTYDPSKLIGKGGDMASQEELDIVKWKLSESQKALKIREQLTDELNWKLGQANEAIHNREKQAADLQSQIEELKKSDGKMSKQAVIAYLTEHLN